MGTIELPLTVPQIADGGDLESQIFGLTTKFNKMQEATINNETPAIGNVLLADSSKPLFGQWIRTTDQKPEKGQRVLCSTIYGIQIGWLNVNGDWKFTNDGSQFTLEHWMPLPELPSVGGV